MIKKIIGCIFISIFGLISIVQAQDLVASIALVARESQDSILLRWLPSETSIWIHAKKKGYKISRAIYNGEEDVKDLSYTEIENSPVNRWTTTKLENYISQNLINEEGRDYQLATFAYGLSQPIPDDVANEAYMRNVLQDDLNTLRDEKIKQEQAFLMAMLPCEQSRLAAKISGYMIEDSDIIQGQTYIYKIELVEPHPKYKVLPGYVKVTAKIYDPSKYKGLVYIKPGHEKLSFSWRDLPYISSYHIDRSLDGIIFKRITNTPIGNVSTPNFSGEDYTTFTDDSLVVGKEYFYKFYAQTSFADEFLFGEAKGIPIDLSPPTRPFLDSIEHVERFKVVLHWDITKYKNEDIKGFVIGRAESDTSRFYRIHEGIIPPDFNKFEDRYFNEGRSNYYKLSVLDQFDNISYSDSRLLVLKDEYPPEPPKPISGIMDSLGKITLKLASQKEQDFMGYRVYKSNADYHEFSVFKETWMDTTLINPKDSIIIDSTTLETLTDSIYYKITALDDHYNESFFSDIIAVPRPDTIPPVSPIISDYKVIDDAVEFELTLSTSSDVVVNYIYRRDEGYDEWELLDSIKSSLKIYQDSTVQVQKGYEYVMKAKDDDGLFSEYSNRVRIKTYFKPRPVKMEIDCQYYIKNETVLLTWELKEQIDEPLIFSIKSNQDFYGRTKPSNSPIYAFKSKNSIESIELKGETPSKTYLVNTAACKELQQDIEENRDYKLFKDEYEK